MLRLLGHPESPGQGLFPSKAFLILALVILLPETNVPRTVIASFIWGDTTRKRALANLRYVLSKVKIWEKLNKNSVFDISPTTVSRAKKYTPCDIEILDSLDNSKPVEVLKLIADIFRGDLLDGLELVDEGGQEFLVSERLKIRNHTTSIALDASTKVNGPHVDQALELLMNIDPHNEAVLRAQIRNMCLTGRSDAAKSLFRHFRIRLDFDIGCEIELKTQELVSQMLPSVIVAPRTTLSLEPKSVVNHELTQTDLPKILLLPPAQNPFGSNNRVGVALVRGVLNEVSLLLGRMRTFAMIAPFTANQLRSFKTLDAAQHIEADYVTNSMVLHRSEGVATVDLGITLTHTKTNKILLSEIIEIDAQNLSHLHAEIANTISNAIAASIKSSEISRFRSTGVASAFVHFVLGQRSLGYGLKELRAAKQHFGRAIRFSPEFSSAHAMFARTQTNEWLILQRSELTLLSQSISSAGSAIELDPLNPLGYRELAHAKIYLGKLDESLSLIKIALKYAPNVADILVDQADMYIHKGDGRKAMKLVKKAIDLNPLSPDSYIWTKATAHFLNENYEAALCTFKMMSDIMPVERLMAACAAMLGDHILASAYRKNWLENYPDFRLNDWSKRVPFENPEVTQRIIDIYRCAGFN